jgi:hypothetical protein
MFNQAWLSSNRFIFSSFRNARLTSFPELAHVLQNVGRFGKLIERRIKCPMTSENRTFCPTPKCLQYVVLLAANIEGWYIRNQPDGR